MGEEAVHCACQMQPGEIILFGNTRLHREEQNNDPLFAKQLAQLGNQLVIGGFLQVTP